VLTRENEIKQYSSIYHTCFYEDDVNRYSYLYPKIFAELDENNNVVSVATYKSKFSNSFFNNLREYIIADIFIDSKVQEKELCLKKDFLLIFNNVQEKARKMGYIAIETNKKDNTIRFVNKDKKIADRKYQLFSREFNDTLYKGLFSKIQETEYTEIELNDESYSTPNFKFVSKNSEDEDIVSTLDYEFLVSLAAKEICTSCKYIHYKLDPKNNIVSFTNRKSKISTYKMSYSDIVKLRFWLTPKQVTFPIELKNRKILNILTPRNFRHI